MEKERFQAVEAGAKPEGEGQRAKGYREAEGLSLGSGGWSRGEGGKVMKPETFARSLGPRPRGKESALYPDGGRTATVVWYKET